MTVQAPLAQPLAAVLGNAQAFVHDPQLAGSIETLAQYSDGTVPHVVSGVPQDAVQSPCEHTCPEAQVCPHDPQLRLSVWVFTSQPSAGMWLQSKYPDAHAFTAQAPDVHTDVALGRLHARAHAPQLALSVLRFASQPVDARWSQSAKPMAQVVTAQAPAAQVLTVAWARLQTVPHIPQLAGSLAKLAQYEGGPAQIASGVAQVVPQWPPEQTWPEGQVVPQAPQLALSAWVFTSQPSAAV